MKKIYKIAVLAASLLISTCLFAKAQINNANQFYIENNAGVALTISKSDTDISINGVDNAKSIPEGGPLVATISIGQNESRFIKIKLSNGVVDGSCIIYFSTGVTGRALSINHVCDGRLLGSQDSSNALSFDERDRETPKQ